MDRRKQCPSCGNILAHSAYQRHIADHTGSVCAGKLSQRETQRKKESSSEESDIFSTDQDSDGDSNSSFDFESSTESCEAIPEMDIEDSDVNLESSICDEDSQDSASGEEVWDSSESEDEGCIRERDVVHTQVKDVLFGMAVFLNFFQLVFHISERALSTLLAFLRTLVIYFAFSSDEKSVLKPLAQAIPHSLYSIRKISSMYSSQSCIREYVVCSKCHTLYSPTQCVHIVNGAEEPKKCSHIEFPHHPQASRRIMCNTP